MLSPLNRSLVALCAVTVAGGVPVKAADVASPKPAVLKKQIPSPEEVIKAAPVAPGLRMDVWAAEPMVSNPVAFAFDGQGRAWIA
jgi:hypothetical protein